MELSIVQFLIVCPLVFIAGFIDAIAGGGGLITMPAYLLAGLPVHNALATNKLSSSMGTAVVTAKYAMNGFINWKRAIICAVFSLMGSFLGSSLALFIAEDIFKIIMLVALPLIAVYVLKRKNLESDKEPFSEPVTVLLCVIIAFIIGAYDGFYGPGTGAFILLLMTGIARISLNDAAGTTKVLNLTSNVTALTVFIMNGKVIYPLGFTAGLFSIAGGYLGAVQFTKNGAKFVKPVIIFVIAIFFIKIIVEFLTK